MLPEPMAAGGELLITAHPRAVFRRRGPDQDPTSESVLIMTRVPDDRTLPAASDLGTCADTRTHPAHHCPGLPRGANAAR